jgi:hypothetical protein
MTPAANGTRRDRFVVDLHEQVETGKTPWLRTAPPAA